MKKIFFYSLIAFSTLVLASCNKSRTEVNPDSRQPELTASAVTVLTKGYAVSTSFDDLAYNKLHAEGVTPSDRQMQLSAYLYPQSGSQMNYFVDETFAKGASDEYWHHTPALYWPIGGTLDLLAYSIGNTEGVDPVFDPADVHWNSDNAASALTLNVKKDFTQNDILFASAHGLTSANGATAVPLVFKHSQAWIEFKVKASLPSVVLLNDITLEDVYIDGDLKISNNGGDAVADWNFRTSTAADWIIDDVNGVYGFSGDASPRYVASDDWQYFDFLLPEQMKTSIMLHYELEGNEKGVAEGQSGNQLSYTFDLPHENWLAGKKYVYEISIALNEITVAPSVDEWGDGFIGNL